MAEETELRRLQNDVEAIYQRLRTVEAVDTPYQRQLVNELHAVTQRVQEMDVRGTSVTQVRLQNMEDDIKEMKEDTKALRVTIRSALITAGLSIGVQIILFFILRAAASGG